MNWLKQWFAARKQRQLARFVTGFCFLMALAIPQAQAQQPCGDNKQQPTAAEQAYAARIRGIIFSQEFLLMYTLPAPILKPKSGL